MDVATRRLTTRLPRLLDVMLTCIVACAGGGAMLLAFPAYSVWPLVFPGLAALFWIVLTRRGVTTILGAALWGVTFFVPLTSWAYISVGSPAPWLGLATVEALMVALWAALFVWARRKVWVGHPLWYCLALVLTWPALELARANLPWGGFPWGLVAFVQVDGPFAGLISVLGQYGMALLVALISMLLALVFTRYLSFVAKIGMAVIGVGTVWALIVTAAFFMPSHSPAAAAATASGQTLEVAVVQGNVSPNWRADFSTPLRVTNNHIAATAGLEPGLDMVIWGEQSVDVNPRTDARAGELISAQARRLQATMLVGSAFNHGDKRYNDLLVYTPDGKNTDYYRKQHPVPFGEYIPNREFFSKISREVDQVPIDMVAGDRPGFLNIDLGRGQTLPTAVGICFEVAYEQIIAEGVLMGGQVVIIPTNNASFGFSDQSIQQVQMARFRALEHNRATISASPNGISAIIGNDGKVKARTQLFTQATLRGTITPNSELTVATRLGSIYRGLFAAIGLGWLVLVVITPRRKQIRI